MNPTPFNPDNWLDLLAYLIIGLPATVAAIATYRSQQRAKQMHEEHREVTRRTLHEVTNDHGTNLRDDIDVLMDAVKEGIQEVRTEIGILREELRHERVERVEGDRRRLL